MQIVSLTTDFGNEDHYVAILKGSILSRKSELNIVDVSHSVGTHDIIQAAFYLENALEAFPEKSIHVIAVHSYYKHDYEIIAFTRRGHHFIGPNNGVFSLIFDDLKEEEITKVMVDGIQKHHLQEKIAHGVACLAHGLGIEELGVPLEGLIRKIGIQPVITKDQIRATIIHVDHFENVIVNLKKEQFEKIRAGRTFSLYYKHHDPIRVISKAYSDVKLSEVCCLFNPAGFLEIAINMGKASSLLSLFKNETIQITFD